MGLVEAYAPYCYPLSVILAAGWWQQHEGSIGIIVGLTAIAVAIVVALMQRRPKAMAWDLMVDEELVNPHRSIPSRLTVTWIDKPVGHPRLIILRLQNVGRRVVLPGDYLNPVNVSLPGGCLLEAAVIRHSGKVYESEPAVSDLNGADHWIFQPPALNSQEWLELQLVADAGEELQVSARIADESRSFRRQELPPSVSRARRGLFIWGWLGVGLGAYSLWHGFHSHDHRTGFFWVGGVMMYLAIGFLVLPSISRSMTRDPWSRV
jgi:hypothetical protein